MELIKVTIEAASHVALIEINRPKDMNALNIQVIKELAAALKDLKTNENIRVVVLTGNEQAFAAGADIKQMAERSEAEMTAADDFRIWDEIPQFPKPLIAAVSGYALGGGSELAMMCDFIVAADNATFGQPEVKIGTIPGAGATQRLTHAVGKSRAMELMLTGRFFKAQEAFEAGMVARIFPTSGFMEEVMKLASEIASRPPIAVQLAKRAILDAYEMPLAKGLMEERKKFYSTFSTQDQKEGMRAFLEKRKPNFSGK